MTRETMVRILRKLLTRHRNLEPEQAAERIADAIEDQLVIESEDDPKPINFDELRGAPHPAETGAAADLRARQSALARLPDSPAVQIIHPDSAEARQILEQRGMRSTIRAQDAPSPPPALRTDPDKPVWDILVMKDELYRSTPEELIITIEHEGKAYPFELLRNIVLEPGLGAIRLSYKDERFMGEDMAAQHLFFTAEAELNIEGAIEKILKTARELHRPKPRHPITPISAAPFTAPIPVKDAQGNVLLKYSLPPSSRATGVSGDSPESIQDNRAFVRKPEGT